MVLGESMQLLPPYYLMEVEAVMKPFLTILVVGPPGQKHIIEEAEHAYAKAKATLPVYLRETVACITQLEDQEAQFFAKGQETASEALKAFQNIGDPLGKTGGRLHCLVQLSKGTPEYHMEERQRDGKIIKVRVETGFKYPAVSEVLAAIADVQHLLGTVDESPSSGQVVPELQASSSSLLQNPPTSWREKICSWVKAAKKEWSVLIFMALALNCVKRDLLVFAAAYAQEGLLQDRVGDALISLSNSGNLAAMLCAVGIVGLYSPTPQHDPATRALFGDNWQWPERLQKEIETRFGPTSQQETRTTTLPDGSKAVSVGMVEIWNCAKLMKMLVGLAGTLWNYSMGAMIGGPMDNEGLEALPRMQRAYVKSLVYVYKPVYHALVIICFPALLAYCWVAAIFYVVTKCLIQGLLQPTVLPAVLRRRFASPIEIIATVSHVEEYEAVWHSYLMMPIAITPMLAFLLPASMRLYTGAGYWSSILLTISERHIIVYLGHMAATGSRVLETIWLAL